MNAAAIAMMLFGLLITWGGAAVCLAIALRRRQDGDGDGDAAPTPTDHTA